jgi:hypothetical protein
MMMLLSKKAKTDENPRYYARKLHQEIVDNCEPTREEFIKLMSGVYFLTEMVWDYALLIPQWAKRLTR